MEYPHPPQSGRTAQSEPGEAGRGLSAGREVLMRTIVITGASRGLGLASAAHFYRQGWRVVGAMRSVEAGLEKIRAEVGASKGDPRLVGVKLDLPDLASVPAAGQAILDAVGAPDMLVHNAGIAGVGSVAAIGSASCRERVCKDV